jgi:hypothetical protein
VGGESARLAVEGASQARQSVTIQGVPHPFASAVPVNQTGVSEDLEVVGDGPLAFAEGFDELAHAYLAFGRGRQHGYEADADRVAQGVEARGELGRLSRIEWCHKH